MINKKRIKRFSVPQHDSSDCGVACLVSVINYFGGSVTAENIRRLSGTTQSGTTMLGLYQAAAKCGLEVTGYEATIEDIIDYKGLLIMHVMIQAWSEHYIVNFGYEDGKFVIWDPARGILIMTKSELEKIWVSKKCLGLQLSNSFRFKSQNKWEKLSWLRRSLKPDLNQLLVSIIIGILVSMLSIVMAIFTQKLIDRILPSKDIKILVLSLALVLILLSARLILNAIRQTILLSQGKSYNTRIVDNFFSSILLLPKSFFDSRKTGDFIARLNDTTRIQRIIADIAGVYIIDLIIVVVSISGLLMYSKIIALFTFCSSPVYFLLVYRWNKKIISGQYGVMSSYAQVESNFIDSLKGILEIKSLIWHKPIEKRNLNVYSIFQEKVFSFGIMKIKLSLLTGILGTVYIIIILSFSSIRVVQAEMTQGVLMAILSIGSTIIPSILNLSLISIPLSEVNVTMSRMFEFTQIEKEIIDPNYRNDQFKFKSLDLKSVSFRFPGRKLLLKNIDLSIKRGQIISLIGDSGGGKSTLVNIIMRFYHPESGSILVNDNTKSDYIPLSLWRSSIGVIPQEIHIFNGTILENLISEHTEDKIKEVMALISSYSLEKFFDSFPTGILTLVGEEGLNLSGGQKQIIAFIRAILQKPNFLLIDEGTSNLDSESEKFILSILSDIKDKVGILMISHRLNIIKRISDRIYILENGTISYSGTHEELIANDNLYKNFWDGY